MIISPVSTVGALHVTLNTPRCGSEVTRTPLGAGGAVCKQIIQIVSEQYKQYTHIIIYYVFNDLHCAIHHHLSNQRTQVGPPVNQLAKFGEHSFKPKLQQN